MLLGPRTVAFYKEEGHVSWAWRVSTGILKRGLELEHTTGNTSSCTFEGKIGIKP